MMHRLERSICGLRRNKTHKEEVQRYGANRGASVELELAEPPALRDSPYIYLMFSSTLHFIENKCFSVFANRTKTLSNAGIS